MAYTPLQGNSSFNPIAGQPDYTQVSLHTSAYNIPIPIFWGRRRLTPNLIWWGWPSNGILVGDVGVILKLPNGFRSGTIPNAGVAFKGQLSAQNPTDGSWATYGSFGGGAGTFDGQLADSDEHWFVPCIFGLCEGPIDSVDGGWIGQDKADFPKDYLTFFFAINGTATQPLWDFWSIFDASGYYAGQGQALAYRNTAYIGSYYVDCGSDNSITIPQQAFLCTRHPNPAYASPGGDGDYSLADIIPDFLTNPIFGMDLRLGEETYP